MSDITKEEVETTLEGIRRLAARLQEVALTMYESEGKRRIRPPTKDWPWSYDSWTYDGPDTWEVDLDGEFVSEEGTIDLTGGYGDEKRTITIPLTFLYDPAALAAYVSEQQEQVRQEQQRQRELKEQQEREQLVALKAKYEQR